MLTGLREAVERERAELMALWERVVNVDSGSYCKNGIDELGRLMSREFAALGFTCQIIDEADCGNHVVGHRAGSGRGRLFLSLHLDTVWPAGTVEDWPFRVDGNRAYGPGVADMKGGWVVMLGALRALKAVGWDGLAQTTVFMTGDEELGSVRGRPHIERLGADHDWTLVVESARANGSVTVGRNAVGALYLTIHGKTAHVAGDFLKGANAIEEAAKQILALHALTDEPTGRIVNCGIVRGGAARQVVADEVWLSVDLRAPDQTACDDLMAKIGAIVAKPTTPGVTITHNGRWTRPPWPASASADLYTLASDIAAAMGMPFGQVISRGGSDGSFTGALGRPTLDGLGIVGGNLCSREEWADIDSLTPKATHLAELIVQLASRA